MTAEEFWSLYSDNHKDLLPVSVKLIGFFSQEFPEGLLENYDIGETVVETLSQLKNAKEFDQALLLTDAIREHHPDIIWKEYLSSIPKFLMEYYGHHTHAGELEKAISMYDEVIEKHYDDFFVSFHLLLYYGHIDLAYGAIERNFETIKESDKLIPGTWAELSVIQKAICLEEYFQHPDKQAAKEEFFKKMLPFGLTEEMEDFKDIDHALYGENTLLQDDKTTPTGLLYISVKMRAMVAMREKNIPFALCQFFFDSLYRYWRKENGENSGLHEFFKTKETTFIEYIERKAGGVFLEDSVGMAAVLWGSVYVYDFLLSEGIIDQSAFGTFKKAANTLKGRVIAGNLSELWRFEFVHRWAKPDSISEQEFETEMTIFQKSLSFKHLMYAELKGEIAEELTNIGELAGSIEQGERYYEEERKRVSALLERYSGKAPKVKYMEEEKKKEKAPPYRPEPKVGRNEPCPCGSGQKYKKCHGK